MNPATQRLAVARWLRGRAEHAPGPAPAVLHQAAAAAEISDALLLSLGGDRDDELVENAVLSGLALVGLRDDPVAFVVALAAHLRALGVLAEHRS